MHLAVWLVWYYKRYEAKSNSTDYTKCGICQNKTKQKLCYSTQGHKAFARLRLLSEFATVLGFDLEENLDHNNAVYLAQANTICKS